ncbi:hypothetical protein [Natronobacterium texcoconense]|uniref:Uncharacterized protein n=1 Tax=Natronobacterium texcoconense TaxID=1095778 RepID=A0A1H1ESE1_NATTX|nr:hypothetical protein [Natronobacterium texcoconense]SDQ91675.1 hypothetical protein SAMN04489842_1683 [Natronobacterium texcoconense]
MVFRKLNLFGYAVTAATLLGASALLLGRTGYAALCFGVTTIVLAWAMRRNRDPAGSDAYPHDRESDREERQTQRDREADALKAEMEQL